LSEQVGAVYGAAEVAAAESTVKLLGQVKTGMPMSLTVTVIVHVSTALMPSVAVYVMVVELPVANTVSLLSLDTVHGE
jgi:hypothetical protein